MRDAGGMRTDYDPPDAPWSAEDLARNLERIAFFTEFTFESGALAPRERETPLLKWVEPIHYALIGDAVERADMETYAGLARRLSSITRLPIDEATEGAPPNLLVLIVSREARRSIAARLDASDAPVDSGLAYRLRTDEYEIPCAASVRVGEPDGAIVFGVILIKAETSGLLRESCAHEEFAQALGPGNDFVGARPSVFNDDQEFALLTAHDEALLRVLYDPRLKPGMSREEGMPLARRVIAELAR